MLRWETGACAAPEHCTRAVSVRDLNPDMITATGGTLLKNKLDFSSVLLYNKMETNVLFEFPVRPKRRKMK